MQDIIALIQAHASFRRITQELETEGSAYAEGLWGSSAALLVSGIAQQANGTVLCVLPTVEQSETFFEDVQLFASNAPLYFPAWETIEADELPDAEVLSQRLGVLKCLYAQENAANVGTAADGEEDRSARIIAAPVQALLQPAPSASLLEANSLVLKNGGWQTVERTTEWLVQRNFRPVRQVEVPGEFCRRGGILDIFHYAADLPVRVEFFGDEVESIRTFDPESQASCKEIERIDIAAIPRPVMNQATHSADDLRAWSSFFDHLPHGSRIMLKEPAEVLSRDHLPESLSGAASAHACHEALSRATSMFPTLNVAALPGVFGGRQVTFHVHSIERYGRDLPTTIRELELVASERKRTIVFCNNDGERERLEELLQGSKTMRREGFEVRIGRMNYGFDWTGLSLALLTHHEIFRRYRQRRITPRYRHTKAVDRFYDLSPGDLVVHAVHGIGIFRGMEVIEKGPDTQECLRLEYAEGSFLHVPAALVELVQKYIGPSEHRPPLSRLGGKGWLKRKEKAEAAVRDMAAELLRMQAVREATVGITHPSDNDWQREFEAAFPYEETEDQLRIIAEVKHDMEIPRPTDRLICGDVGYGKTEIAMRAAFKAVMGGRQVAVLVPTTVLAAQHTQTFSERMADYPVNIRMLSRFLTRSQQVRVIEELAGGQADIVIGTHRLVQPDVDFKDLGLVIIDEEQRFGVEHKERLKRLRETVDVLTLTATPIPRTLHMSLLGIRDIATLETPPRDRLTIHTRLVRYNPDRIRQAILHEMARGGQIFFVHNRVQTIDAMASTIRELVPEAKIGVGHGQMPERQLAHVMRDFIEHRTEVLMCTTIIESGLDIPNANTIIINQADMFGLAELHQLRGRVGRYKHRAYAYILVPADRPLTPIAERRLKAIEEFCELGAGFRIAMRDLELRGAGNILGSAQSGHIAAVGYDMYCRLLEHAARALKHQPVEERPEVSLSLGVVAFLPQDYVGDATQRIGLYRKLQRATQKKDIHAVRTELRDRFGELPQPTENLLTEVRIRQLAAAAGINSIIFRDSTLMIQSADCPRSMAVLSVTGHTVRQVDSRTLYIRPGSAGSSGELLSTLLIDILKRGLSVELEGTQS